MSKFWLLIAFILCTFGCGYVGGPMVPLANIPSAVTDLAAIQRGGTIIAHFTLPALTTEHIVIPGSLTLDLRIGVWPEGAGVDTWASGAKRIANPSLAGGIATYEIPSADWTNKEVVIASRVIAENGKGSAWSNYAILPVVPPPDPPHDLSASSTPAGIRLTWHSNATHFRVLRKTAEEAQYAAVAPDVTAQEWTDPHSVFGTAYSYMVQSVVPLGNNKQAESELVETKITAEAPPPPAPAGLAAVPGTNTIELTWEVPAGDITGYRVYRAEGSGTLQKIADLNAIPTYSDHAVEHGKTYRYAISAVNSAGREGARSETRKATMQ